MLEILRRLGHWICLSRKKGCGCCCLFCEYYDLCKKEEL